ncbi:hypothetical protein L596_001536 [Steinernema carpocapsae]|uniref:Uncharacterized protein n=1 Tax=Steinernema carpocapsae TaxID=34508 RepID=A0A4U8UNJ3_STECR|nr:hypothetical protein L596_001536 [Steinernema carpocapsae]
MGEIIMARMCSARRSPKGWLRIAYLETFSGRSSLFKAIETIVKLFIGPFAALLRRQRSSPPDCSRTQTVSLDIIELIIRLLGGSLLLQKAAYVSSIQGRFWVVFVVV